MERKHVMYFLLNIIFCSAKVDGEAVVPVSYTHLDVYKRQVQAGGKTEGGAGEHKQSH